VVHTFLTWFLDALPLILGIVVVVGLLALPVAAWRARAIGWRRAIGATLPGAVLLVALGTIGVLTLGDPMGPQPDRINLIPFRDQYWALQGQIDAALSVATLLANVVLFIPLGAALAARFPRASGWGLVAVAAFVSLTVEGAQAVLDIGRLADITDVLANSFGAAVGVAGWGAMTAGGRPNERSA
jgi:glycopeptide antibiotics resistance protein